MHWRDRTEQVLQWSVMVAVLAVTCVVGWNATAQYRAPKQAPSIKVGDLVSAPTNAPQLLAIERSTCPHCQKLKPTLAKMVAEARAAGITVGFRDVQPLDDTERAFAAEAGFLPGEVAAHDEKVLKVKGVPLVVYVVNKRVRWVLAGSAVTDADWAAFRSALAAKP